MIGNYHAIYISTATILIEPDGAMNVEVRVFSDDLEDAIQNFSNKRPFIVGNDNPEIVLEGIEDYILSKLEIQIEGQELKLKAVSVDNKGESTWIRLTSKSSIPIRSITLTNSIFTEIFESQTNMMTVQVGEETRYIKFSKNKIEQELMIN